MIVINDVVRGHETDVVLPKITFGIQLLPTRVATLVVATIQPAIFREVKQKLMKTLPLPIARLTSP
jgi:hypothetical protein